MMTESKGKDMQLPLFDEEQYLIIGCVETLVPTMWKLLD